MTTARGTLFDALNDRILILNRAGKVVYFNAAARGDFDGTLSALLVHPDLRAAITRVAAQPGAPMQRLKLPRDKDTEVNISVTTAPNGTDVAVVVHAAAPDIADGAIEGRTVAEVMRQHLHAPLSAFVKELTAASALSTQGQAVLERLEKVMDLIALFGSDALTGDERLLPTPLVEAVCAECANDPTRSRVVLSGFDDTLPPVYGAGRWLKRALREILDNAMGASPRQGATVEIRAQQSGEFLTLRVLNHGVMSAASWSKSKFVPFSAAARTGSAATHVGIGLPLAQRIVELHGGSMKVRTDEAEGTTEVTVQLPTGAPRFSATQLDAAQVQRYAEDLARLMARRKSKRSETAEPVRGEA